MLIDIKVLPPTNLTPGELNSLREELVAVCYRKMEMYDMVGIVEAKIEY